MEFGGNGEEGIEFLGFFVEEGMDDWEGLGDGRPCWPSEDERIKDAASCCYYYYFIIIAFFYNGIGLLLNSIEEIYCHFHFG
jgi:hypothetical protein